MIQRRVTSARTTAAFLPISRILACLMLLAWLSTSMSAQNSGATTSSPAPSTIPATHILGFEGLAANASGNLSIQKDVLQFQKAQGAATTVGISSIQDVFLGEQDRQVGGTPMAIGRAATPYGGGRLIALFSHKKFDSVTVEYVDSSGGFHGAIFQIQKGQGQVLRDGLVAQGAHLKHAQEEPAKETAPEVKK
jgi:hypothetical protein